MVLLIDIFNSLKESVKSPSTGLNVNLLDKQELAQNEAEVLERYQEIIKIEKNLVKKTQPKTAKVICTDIYIGNTIENGSVRKRQHILIL